MILSDEIPEYQDLASLIGKSEEHKYLRISLGMLRVLNRLSVSDGEKALCILGYSDELLADALLEMFDLSESASAFLRSFTAQVIAEDDKAASVFSSVDMYKVAKLATDGLSYRDFAVYCAIGSCVGSSPARAITQSVIAARAAGYFKIRDLPAGTNVLTRHQVARAVDQLVKRDMLLVLSPTKRVTYYSGWKLHGGHSKDKGLTEFAKCVARIYGARHRDRAQIMMQAFNEELARHQLPPPHKNPRAGSPHRSQALHKEIPAPALLEQTQSYGSATQSGAQTSQAAVQKVLSHHSNKPETETDVFLRDFQQYFSIPQNEFLRFRLAIQFAIGNQNRLGVQEILDNLRQAKVDKRLGTADGIEEPFLYALTHLRKLKAHANANH